MDPMKYSWKSFAQAEPDLANFGVARFKAGPAYLATVDAEGMPRLHPVTPLIIEGHLLLVMGEASPKGEDLQRGSAYALHCTVGSKEGGKGEFWVKGHAVVTDHPKLRQLAAQENVQSKERSNVFVLSVERIEATSYSSDGKPVKKQWKAAVAGSDAVPSRRAP